MDLAPVSAIKILIFAGVGNGIGIEESHKTTLIPTNKARVHLVQPADIGWPTGNEKKLSCSQAQLGQATGLPLA